MKVWHLTPETPRVPFHVSAGETVNLQFGTWPVEDGQETWIDYRIAHPDGTEETGRVGGTWNFNRGANSYWFINLGPFADGDRVEYRLRGRSPEGIVEGGRFEFRVSPKIHLAILWHQHQPLYKDLQAKTQKASYPVPWVRLHAIRDYYSMAALLEHHPKIHLTINLTPVLLWQIEDYAERGATDRALELTLMPASRLSAAQREDVLEKFFEADWHTQIFVWPRYRELFERRRNGERFSTQDLTDLQMWFNLAWFAPEVQEGNVELPDGRIASVRALVEKSRGYTRSEIEAMVGEQVKILENIVAIHRRLQDRGQIEVSTTPFFHPILPLIIDTDQATIDRDGAVHPRRFHRPEDAAAQVRDAVGFYRERFGRLPSGMWPAEGAVGQSAVPLFVEAGCQWIATDRGVLARSGQHGYNVRDPNVLCQAYRAEDAAGGGLAVFFRDTALSDSIGFRYQQYVDPVQAAGDFVHQVKERFAWRVDDPQNRIVSVTLDGENAWGAYAKQGRPFLHALYTALAAAEEIRTVTFAEYLKGSPDRRVAAHPVGELRKVYDLFQASWIDENGSRPGNDLGTWIGEAEENHGWDLLREGRDLLERIGATPSSHSDAFQSLYAAEGSDWFWWFGEDQASDSDAEFDDMFRMHVKNVYRSAARRPPARLDHYIVPHAPIWTFARPIRSVLAGDRLIVRTNCAGRLTWKTDIDEVGTGLEMIPAGGAMAGLHRYGLTLGPFNPGAGYVEFCFTCSHPDCCGGDSCCRSEVQRVEILNTQGMPP